MLERYRPETFEAVRAFARRLKNFGYVREIIRWHNELGFPGSCWVWRVRGRVAAFQAVAYLNPDDAWLWAMRVDPEFANRGVATRFTRALFPVVRRDGRTWVGLNTLEQRGEKPTYRVCEKLGMRIEDTDATEVFWRLPGSRRPPRPRRLPGIQRRMLGLGRRTIFHQGPGWLWSRLLPARQRWVNPGGFRLHGVPVHVARDRWSEWYEEGGMETVTTVNLFDRPADLVRMARSLSGYATGRRALLLNYPADWRREFRRAFAQAVPGLRRGKNCFFSCWRVYGKRLHPR